MKKIVVGVISIAVVLASLAFVLAVVDDSGRFASTRTFEKECKLDTSGLTCAVPKAGEPCEPGQSWCEDRTRGGYEMTCECDDQGNNCEWSEESSCGTLIACSSSGWGGSC
jgi:hypothetical protein